MIDLGAAMARVRGMVIAPDATLAEHLDPVPPWAVVAREHTLPLLVGSALVASLLRLLLAPSLDPGTTLTLTDMLTLLVLQVGTNFVLLVVMAGVLGFFSGLFDGSSDFNASYALAALSMTPLYVGEAILVAPLLGPLVTLAGLIYGLSILYRGVPAALGIAHQMRGRHFVLSMASLFVIWMLAGLALGPYLMNEPG